MDYATMTQLFGGAAGAGGAALGSGLYGQDSLSGIMGMQAQGAGPMAMGSPGVQGTGSILNSPLATDANAAKLAAAPIDPAKIMQMLEGGQQQAPRAQASSPAAGRSVQFVQQAQPQAQGYAPQSLAQLLGK